MDSLKFLIIGLFAGVIIAQEVSEGSGYAEELSTSKSGIVQSQLNADTEEGDDFGFGSGDITDIVIEEGSGVVDIELELTDEVWKTVPMPDRVKCDADGSCFCTDTSGNKVLTTRVFKQYPVCKPTITDITNIIPSRDKPVKHAKTEVYVIETTPGIEFLTTKEQEVDTDVYIVERPSNQPLDTDEKINPYLNNKIPTNPPLVKHNEKGEEDNNVIANHQKGVHPDKEPITDDFTHPGILAAIIVGGVVLLLCLVLLIMFIVYRMKKKDEGSYPLDSSKQSPMYAKVPDKEFFA